MADKPLAFAWLNIVGPQESTAVDQMDPATAELCRMQLVKQHMLFKQQTAALHSAVKLQIQLANEIPVFIDEGGKAVQVWNPLDSVKAEVNVAHSLQGAEQQCRCFSRVHSTRLSTRDAVADGPRQQGIRPPCMFDCRWGCRASTCRYCHSSTNRACSSISSSNSNSNSTSTSSSSRHSSSNLRSHLARG